MPLESLDCPNCGAPLPDAGGRSIVVCAHCGSSIRIHDQASPAAPAKPEQRESSGPPAVTVGEYGRPPSDRPERSALTSVTLGPSDVKEVIQLLRDRQELAAIQLYHAKVGGTLGDAKDAIEAIQAGLKDASAPPPAPSASFNPPRVSEIQDLLRQGNRLAAIQRYRQVSGVGLREATTVIEGFERQLGLAPAARGRARSSGLRSWLSVFGVVAIFIVCISGGCGAYLQTKPIFKCSLDLVKADVIDLELLRPPIRGGFLVLAPGFRESSGFDSWRLSAEYITPVWGANGIGLAYVALTSSSSGSDAVSAQLFTTQGQFRLRNWGPIDCPDPN